MLTACKECNTNVSTEAPYCPRCGIARPGIISAQPKRRITFTSIIIACIIGVIIYTNLTAPKKPEPEKPPLDFAKPLYTSAFAPICPISVFVDMRSGQGLQAFRSAQFAIFGRAEKFEKLGCQVFNEGMRVYGIPMEAPFEQYVYLSLAPGGFQTLFTGKVWLTN